MKKTRQLILLAAVLIMSVMCLAVARADEDSDGEHLKADVVGDNSAITGTAVLDIGEDGVRGKLKADNLQVGHAYTVWFFYFEGNNQGGPGRFASTVAEDDDFIFRGSVGGLKVSHGAKVRLVIFDHANLGLNNVTRANNVLTPAGGLPAAHADFNIP